MSTSDKFETPDMRREANRLRHAMQQLRKDADRVRSVFYSGWADAVRETAIARVGSDELAHLLTDPHYDRALDANPDELMCAIDAWCARMHAELDAWHVASPGAAESASLADHHARSARSAHSVDGAIDLDTTATDSAEGADS